MTETTKTETKSTKKTVAAKTTETKTKKPKETVAAKTTETKTKKPKETVAAPTMTEVEINRELKRLASIKCRKKGTAAAEKAQVEYDKLVLTKNALTSKTKAYRLWTAEEIDAVTDIEFVKKAINGMASRVSVYKDGHDVQRLWLNRRARLEAEAEYARLKSVLG